MYNNSDNVYASVKHQYRIFIVMDYRKKNIYYDIG